VKASRISLAALLLLALPQARDWKRVLPGLALAYPRDHGAHPAYRTEWWYLTGNLAAASGRRFGFQLTIFRRGLDPRPPAPGASALRARHVWAGHMAITDIERHRTFFAERLRRGGTPLAHASTEDLDLVLEDWTLSRSADDRLLLSAADPASAMALELELVPRKPPVLHGVAGYSRKGREPGNASAYMSWTRLSAAGRLSLGELDLRVTGAAWFDHEFGSSVLDGGIVGWDWFGLQLDDGRELMAYFLRDADGHSSPVSAGTLVERDGYVRNLGAADLAVEVRGTWQSPRSGAAYPARWTLTVPSAELRLDVVPLVADAELETGGSTGVVYWEGPVGVSGSATGRGYGELTGYAGPLGAEWHRVW